MKRIWPLLLLLGACAPGGLLRGRGGPPDRVVLWDQAHQAMAAGRFVAADSLFGRLSREHPQSAEGRESLFYLGALRLDPRNPEWDPDPAEARLRRYLDLDTVGGATIGRRPEADILLQVAHQLNLPPDERISGLQPQTRIVTAPPQRIVRAKESQEQAAQIADLKDQVAAREGQIKKLQEELDRIRRTLTRHQDRE